MKRLSDEEMLKILQDAWEEYKGDCSVLMSAMGALVLGREVGWQGIRVTMSAATFRKYEKILGVRFRDVLPDRTKNSRRIRGIRIADGLGKFWQSLSGGLIPATEGKIVELGT
jgi:hypothetical protein